MKKNAVKLIVFVLAFILCFCGVTSVLDFKYLDSTFKVKMFYEQEDNTVDVLVLGSSHAYQSINTAVLWKEYGIAAYNLCGAAQPIWNTYYYLEEALKTQMPKVIILDTYTLHYTDDYSEVSFAIKNTYGLKWSDTKTEAIRVSFDTEKYGMQYYFPILQYHSRYNDLNKSDFYPYQANKEMYQNHKGFYCYFQTTALEEPDLSEATYFNILTKKNDEYYRKILDLATSHNIPVIVTAFPFAAETYQQAYFNTAKNIAENDYNFPFYNFLTDYKDAVGIDYATDFSDKQHLNYLGNTKITRFLGDILQNEYHVPDRRGDEKYASWEADAQVYYKQLENHEVTAYTSLEEYIPVFSNDRYTIIMTETIPGGKTLSQSALNSLRPFFSGIGISDEQAANGGAWIFENGELTYYNQCYYDNYQKTVKLSRFNDALIDIEIADTGDGKRKTKRITVDKEDKTTVNTGINIYIYDTFTQSTVDTVGLNFSNGEFVRKSK